MAGKKSRRGDYLKKRGDSFYGDPNAQQNAKNNFLTRTKQNTIETLNGPPTDSDGNNGDLTVRNLGGGYVLYVKNAGAWRQLSATPSALAQPGMSTAEGANVTLVQFEGGNEMFTIYQQLLSSDMGFSGNHPMTGDGVTIITINGSDGHFDGNRMDLGETTTGILKMAADVRIADHFESIDKFIEKLAPPRPDFISDCTIEWHSTTENYVWEGKQAGTGTTCQNITDRSVPYFKINHRTASNYADGFRDGASGQLKAGYSDNNGASYTETGFITLTPNSGSIAFGGAGSDKNKTATGSTPTTTLKVEEDWDPWYGVQGKENIWEALDVHFYANISSSTYDSTGAKKVKISHTSTAGVESICESFEWFKDAFDVIASAPVMTSLSTSSITSYPSSTQTKSGIVAYDAGSFDVAMACQEIISKFYAVNIAKALINGVSEYGVLYSAPHPAAATLLEDTNHTLTATIPIDTSEYKHSGPLYLLHESPMDTFHITGKCYNYRGDEASSTYIPAVSTAGVYVDSFPPKSDRKNSGNTQYPAYGTNATTQYGNFTYSHSTYLTTSNFFELQEFGDAICWPTGDFISQSGHPAQTGSASDVNYNAEIGTTDGTSIDGNYYRWFTKKFTGALNSASGFSITLDGAGNFSGDTHDDTVIVQAIVHNGVSELTTWLDCSTDPGYQPGDPNPGTVADGDLCVVNSSSTLSYKYCTFGTATYSGHLFVRVGLKDNDRYFQDISVVEL